MVNAALAQLPTLNFQLTVLPLLDKDAGNG